MENVSMVVPASGSRQVVPVRIVDCDVHPYFADMSEIVDYVPEPWRTRHLASHLDELELTSAMYQTPASALRLDARSPSGAKPGVDPDWMDRQLLQEQGVDYAVLLFQSPKEKSWDPPLTTALDAGNNGWMVDTWLGKYNWHGRYYGAIKVCPEDPEGAVREIERWAGHPHVIQVHAVPETPRPIGHPLYRPVLAACARHGLPFSMHPSKGPGMTQLSPVGFPSYHMENFTGWAVSYMAHLASLIFEGIFDEVPDLRVVLVEAGFTWLAPLVWRMDQYWKAVGGGYGDIKRAPSEYVREHVRVTTQPVEEPEPAGNLVRLMEWMRAEEIVMFSSDYPHYDFDSPQWLLPRLSPGLRERVLAGTALDLYTRLPRVRPVDRLDESRPASPSMAPARVSG